MRGAGPAVPGIVGQVDEQIGAAGDALSGDLRKDRFVADEHAQPHRPERQRFVRGAGGEVADAHHQRFEKGQVGPQGHVLAERHQVLLGVARCDAAVRAEQDGAVVVADQLAAVGLRGEGEQRRAGEQPGVGCPGEGGQPPGELVPLRVEGQGGFRPDHQFDVRLADRLAGEAQVGVDRGCFEGGRPLDHLVDIALDHRHLGLQGPRAVVDRDPVAHRRVTAEEHQCGAGQEQQAALAADVPAHVAPLPVDDAHEQAVAEHHPEGDQVVAAQVRGLDELRLGVEAVTEVHPGKAGEQHRTQPVEPHPEHRRQPDQGGHRSFPVPGAAGEQAEQRAEHGRIEGHVGSEQHQAGQGEEQGQAAVAAEDDQDPVEQGEMGDEPADKPDQGAATGPGGKRDEQQGYQRDEQQRPPADPAGHGQSEQAGAEQGRQQPAAAPLTAGEQRRHCARSGRI